MRKVGLVTDGLSCLPRLGGIGRPDGMNSETVGNVIQLLSNFFAESHFESQICKCYKRKIL